VKGREVHSCPSPLEGEGQGEGEGKDKSHHIKSEIKKSDG